VGAARSNGLLSNLNAYISLHGMYNFDIPPHRSVAVTVRAVGWTRQCGVPELPRVFPRGPPGGHRGRRGRVLRSAGHSPNPSPKLTHIPVGLICTQSVEIVCYIPLFISKQGMVHPRRNMLVCEAQKDLPEVGFSRRFYRCLVLLSPTPLDLRFSHSLQTD